MPARLARLYFVVQGVAVVAWWSMLLLRPATRTMFEVRDAPDIALLAFAPPDLVILACGSLLVAALYGRRIASVLAWLVAGAALYGALYTLTTAVTGVAPWIGAVLMTLAAMASIVAANSLSRESSSAVSRDLPPRRSSERGA